MQTANIKSSAHELIDRLPDNISWSDLAYHIEVRASIERGIEDSDSDRIHTTCSVKQVLTGDTHDIEDLAQAYGGEHER